MRAFHCRRHSSRSPPPLKRRRVLHRTVPWLLEYLRRRSSPVRTFCAPRRNEATPQTHDLLLTKLLDVLRAQIEFDPQSERATSRSYVTRRIGYNTPALRQWRRERRRIQRLRNVPPRILSTRRPASRTDQTPRGLDSCSCVARGARDFALRVATGLGVHEPLR